MQLDDVLTVLDALERTEVRDAVFGGLAMAAHGFDRATRDLDLFVAPDATNVERLRAALTEVPVRGPRGRAGIGRLRDDHRRHS